MFHECEARYRTRDPGHERVDAMIWPRRSFVANLLHLLGFTDV